MLRAGLALGLLLVGLSLATSAQRVPPPQSGDRAGQATYDGRFVFSRIRYGGWYASWNHDYPRADRHLQHILDDLTLLPVNTTTSSVLTLDDPALFLHPMIYLSEPGFWPMTAAEGARLREYLLKGGFIVFDDFEQEQWDNMAANMRRVLPGLRWIELDLTHPVFHAFFEMTRLDFPHPMYPSMIGRYYALFEENDREGRMLALANHDNDLAELWEWSDTGQFPVNDTNEAYKLGVNYVMYAMTH
ncbi:MAG: DUF4159 domain-containing protein [Acidimicrobiia bacterium]|nr:DUF4159 domain-containing protein [Acidimicrobiia bacterium]